MFKSYPKVVPVLLFIGTAMVSNVQAGEIQSSESIASSNHWVEPPTLNTESSTNTQISYLQKMMGNIFSPPAPHHFETGAALSKEFTDLEPGWELKPNKDGLSLSFHY